jgi:hypothetical protein
MAHPPPATVVGQLVGMRAEEGRKPRPRRPASVALAHCCANLGEDQQKVPGWQSWKTLASVTAYDSFGGEVEARTPP